MNNKYNEHIIITRTGENSISISCEATVNTIERFIIGLFEEINNLDNSLAMLLVSDLIDIAARKDS